MCKFSDNIDKLQDVMDLNNFNLETAKACHSLIHNLIECYQLEEDWHEKQAIEILSELAVAFGFLNELQGGQLSNMKVYQDRLVIPPARPWGGWT